MKLKVLNPLGTLFTFIFVCTQDLDASVVLFNVTELDKSNKDCVTNIMTNFSRGEYNYLKCSIIRETTSLYIKSH